MAKDILTKIADGLALAKEAGGGPLELSKKICKKTPGKPVTPQAISQWKQVPHDRVLTVSQITKIDPYKLRPDLYPAPRKSA